MLIALSLCISCLQQEKPSAFSVNVNAPGVKSLQLIIDTGSARSYVFSEKDVKIPSISIGSRETPVSFIHRRFAAIWEVLGKHKIDGILGMDVLKKFDILINWPAGSVEILDPQQVREVSGFVLYNSARIPVKSIPLDFDEEVDGRARIPVTFGGVSTSAIIDTAAARSCIPIHVMLDRIKPSTDVERIATVKGWETVQLTTSFRVNIGGIFLPGEVRAGMRGADALLGMDALSQHWVCISTTRRRFYIAAGPPQRTEKARHFHQSARQDQS